MTAARRLAVLAVVMLAALGDAPAAGAQTPVLDAAAGTTLDSATETAIIRTIEAARSRGLPPEPLLAKVREGRLKRAGGARIRGAVMALAVRLDTARAALGPGSTSAELSAGADALAAGAPPAALRSVRAASAARPVTAPLGTLAQLLASRVSAPRAVSMILELMNRNVPPAAVVAFGNSVETDVSSGVPADEAAVFRYRAVGAASVPAAAMSTDAAGLRTLNGAAKAPPPTTKRRP